MFCPNCGTQNDENNAKCQKCGFSIKGAVAPKFKGTMLMMNAPPGVAQRLPSPGGVGPVPKTAPVPAVPGALPKKGLAKMTMIGVAPPSPGAVAPPAGKPDAKTGTLVQGSTPPPKSVRPGSIPRPAPATRPAAGATPPVNPFGGTMLMGAVPEVKAPPPAQASTDTKPLPPLSAAPVEAQAAAPTASVPVPQQDTVAALSTTTPSVAPPAPLNPERLPSDMPTVASAVAPIVEPTPPVAQVALPRVDWAPPVTSDALEVHAPQSLPPESHALAEIPRQRSASLSWVLAVLTLGIYPLVTWLSRRRKANGAPI